MPTLYFTRTYTVSMYLREYAFNYPAVQSAAEASNLFINQVSAITLAQSVNWDGYDIMRTALHFNTASIPDDATITGVILRIKQVNTSTTNVIGIVQNGQPDYPHNPAVVGDYLYSHYSGDGGQFGPYGSDGYKLITFSEEGRSWINKEGVTKIVLRCKTDADNDGLADGDMTAPVSTETAAWFYNDASQAAQLRVTYELAYDYPLYPVIFPLDTTLNLKLKDKCINYERSMNEMCLTINHNTYVTSLYLQDTYASATYVECDDFKDIKPSEQLGKLELEELKDKDYIEIINNFIRNIKESFLTYNQNNEILRTWLHDYDPSTEGHEYADLVFDMDEITDDKTDEELEDIVDKLFDKVKREIIPINNNIEMLIERF